MKIVLIRHGDPDYEHDTLTEAGWKEAAALAEFMKKEYGPLYEEGRVAFYCSPLGRARDTAGETLKALGAKAEVLPFLREFNARIEDPRTGRGRGTWDLMPMDWINQEEHYSKDLWWQSPLMSTGTDVKPKYDAVCAGLDEILRRHGYEREGYYYRAVKPNHDVIVLFCHMGVSSVIMSHLINCSPSIPWQNGFIAPTSRTIYDMEEREEGIAIFRMRCMGDTTHLTLAGVPVSDSGLYGEVYPEHKRGYPDER